MTTHRRSYRPTVDSLDARVLLSAGGLTPAQIRQAYSENINFNVGGQTYAATGARQTIAIVDGGLDNSIFNDLATFDQTFGLAAPPSFEPVYFDGAQYTESVDSSLETSMDVEWSHAVAPGANILLVQAASMSPSDLMTAVNWARQQPGVSVVSMSWGWHESSSCEQYDADFTTPAGHTGVTFVAASGDTGAWTYAYPDGQLPFGVSWPAVEPTVLSVGGTNLQLNSNGSYAGETTWNEPNGAGGGGVSTLYREPSYQFGVQSTGLRTVPDVAYNADSDASPIWVYDSQANGWNLQGGTSEGAPQCAGLIAMANQGRALVGLSALDGATQTLPAVYRFSSAFHDVTSGNNGYYTAHTGYDEATGLGSPTAVQLVGDLAFHVSNNYVPEISMAAVASQWLSAGSQSSAAVTPLLSVAGSSVPARPGNEAAVPTGTTNSPTQEILITPAPTSPAQSIGHRHDHLDLSLGSLMDEDLVF
jgi:subtilase family serine protease